MAIQWGNWEYSGGNGMRVGVDISVESSITHSEAGCTFTIDYYTQNQYSYSDPQILHFSGQIVDNMSINNNAGGAAVKRITLTYVYNYGAHEYGSSPGRRTFGCSISGAYNGVTPSVSASAAITARPYGQPSAPDTSTSNLVHTASNDLKFTWTNNDTIGEPYQNIKIQQNRDSAGWHDIDTVGPGQTSYTDTGVASNHSYQYRCYATGVTAAGVTPADSGYSLAAGPAFSPPAAPSGCAYNSSTHVVSWTNNTGYSYSLSGFLFNVYQSKDRGVTWTLRGTVPGNTTSMNDTAGWDATVPIRYRVNAEVDFPTYYSAYSNQTADTVPASAPAPNAPSLLDPNGPVLDGSKPIRMTWKHNPTDGSAQTQYSLQHRSPPGTGTWTTVGPITNSVAQYTLPVTYSTGVTVEWQVQTWGAGPTASPFSALASFSTAPSTVTKYPLYLNPITGALEADHTGGSSSGGGGGYTPGTPPNVQTFGAGTSTWTKPAQAIWVEVEIVGGGGSGAGAGNPTTNNISAGSGGGGGGYCRRIYDASVLGSTATVVVGAGASPKAAGNNDGNAGGNSSFTSGTATVLNAGGGGAGQNVASVSNNTSGGGAGGTATGGHVNIPGEPGETLRVESVTGDWPIILSLLGGASHLGTYTASPGTPQGSSGRTATPYGCGGGGSMARGSSPGGPFQGGTGTDGICIITTHFSNTGPTGPQGPAGIPYYQTFNFVSAVTTWNMAHGQGRKSLSVYAMDSGGSQLIGDLTYPDNNNMQITFAAPESGTATVYG